MIVENGVYNPSEDTYLVLDNLNEGKGLAIDVGTGCGVIGLALVKMGWDVIATDISPVATKNALSNAKVQGVKGSVQCITADLLKFLREGITIDLLIFNAPYVPSPEVPEETKDISWHGGSNGEVINKFLNCLVRFNAKKLLLVQSTLSDIEGSLNKLKEIGYSACISNRYRSFFEDIVLIRAERRSV